MNHITLTFCFLLILSLALPNSAEDAAVKLPDKENFHLFLLAGQSNMAGRGKVAAEDKVAHPRVLALGKDGKWRPAVDPLHWDKGSAGVGLARSFAIALAEKDDKVTIGLIPAACGGSPISTWTPGGYHGQTKSHPYDDALARARRAMQDGTLQGILWHQGESDSNPAAAAKYQARLTELITRFRKELEAPQLPLVIGQLGQFKASPFSDAKRQVDAAHQAIAKEDAHIGFAESTDLTSNPDNVHFDAESLREFGRRYAEVYVKLTGKAETDVKE